MRIYPFFIAQAGCPHRCVYCRQSTTTGQTRPVTPEQVAQALPTMLDRGAGGEIAFYGGSFTCLPRARQSAYLQTARPYLDSGLLAGIRLSTRPDALGDEQLAFLAEQGVTTVEIGCQSFSAAVLIRAERGYAPKTAEAAVARVKGFGLRVGIQLMPGLPGGDRTEALTSLARALRLGPDFLRIYPTVVLRDTPLAEQFTAGAYLPLTLEEAVDLCAEMLWHCRRTGVPVIRLGLQAVPELTSGTGVTAGPWHPAFGQLVRSRLWLRALQTAARAGTREVFVAPGDLAEALGHKRHNVLTLQKDYPQFSIRPAANGERETLRDAQHIRRLQEAAAYPIQEFFR